MSSTATQPFWLAGTAVISDDLHEVLNPYDDGLVARVSQASPADVEAAVSAAASVSDDFAASAAHVRADALDHVARRLQERREEVALLITAESGKPLKWARVEVDRATSTFRWAAGEARRWSGVLQRLDTELGHAGRMALVRRVSRGPVLGITPFNFPLNLVAHKVAPALAVGAPIILKPAPATPLTSLLLGELLAETGLPDGVWSVLPIPNSAAPGLVADPRLPVVSFTGSVPVGWAIRDAVPRKHVTLELGGNAAVIVCSDWSSEADLAWAADRIAMFSMYQAGQSCVSVQRVFIHRELYDRLRDRIVDRVSALQTGAPSDDTTEVGPLINVEAATRVEEWVNEALGRGAEALTGGVASGTTTYPPTVLVNAPATAKVNQEEVFGPVVTLDWFESTDDAFDRVNDSRFGLQAGVFTHDLTTAFSAGRRLRTGGVIVGDVPSYRADQMPYGGLKDSGSGREGVQAAMEDLTEQRVLVLTGIDV